MTVSRKGRQFFQISRFVISATNRHECSCRFEKDCMQAWDFLVAAIDHVVSEC